MEPAAPADLAGRQRSRSPRPAVRRKKGAPRSRVTRACDRCKRKKIRCTGLQPCEICIRAETPCTWNALYSRGRRQPILANSAVGGAASGTLHGNSPLAEGPDTVSPLPGPGHRIEEDDGMGEVMDGDSSRVMNANTDPLPQAFSESGGRTVQRSDGLSSRFLNTAFPLPVPSSRTSPEPTQTDRQGHYVGPASGVSFLLRVQKRLHQTLTFSKTSSIFTFGDAPLPDFDLSFFVLPPREEAQKLADRYFDFAVPTHRFLHRPTVNEWLSELYETMGTMHNEEGASAKIAVLFMVFAQAREYMPSPSGPGSDVSSRYFLMADQQLSKERGEVRLTSVQARLCQCFYLLSVSRINHCWTLFGMMAHLALAIGLNRNRRADPSNGFGHIEVECRRRVFWCAYSLDNYLSAALGRPRTFHDADIDAELPSVIDDSELNLHPPAASLAPRRAGSLMVAAVAHVKLSRILSVILQDLYPIRPLSTSARAAITEKCAKDLRNWHNEMAKFLDPDNISAALLLPIYQRQRNVLNFSYWHAMILTHRPFLLSNFARLQQSGNHDRNRPRSHRGQLETSVRECLKAAMHIVDTVDELVQTSQMFRAFWFTSYFAFSAVVVLYVYVIQESSSPPESYQVYLDAATKCQGQLAGFAEKESLAQRYCLVLEELRLEAVRHSENSPRANQAAHPAPYGRPSFAAIGGDGGVMLPEGGFGQFPLVDDGSAGLNASPSSFLADVTSWGNFDSMVTSGLGHLEGLIGSGEPFGF